MVRALVACLSALPAIALFSPAAAASTSTLHTQREAWYRTSPACVLLLACSATQNAYPAGTVHVGILAGQETDRTYIAFDTSQLPSSGPVAGVTLTLPVGGADSGTVNASAADLEACWVTTPFDTVYGSTDPPPTIDCKKPAAAMYAVDPSPHYSLDITGFFARWMSGTPNNGIALVPAGDSSPSADWQVALAAGPQSAPSGIDPITATVAIDGSPTTTLRPNGGGSPASPPSIAPPPGGAPTGTALPAAAATVLPAASRSGQMLAPPPRLASPQRGFIPAGPAPLEMASKFSYQYPVVWLTPLALILGAAYVLNVMRRPVVVRRRMT